MKVERVRTEHGSRIEPGLEDNWPERKKLEWKLAVIEVDSGLRIGMYDPKCPTKILGFWVRDRYCKYGFTVAGASVGAFTFHAAWDFLNGVEFGYKAARRVTEAVA